MDPKKNGEELAFPFVETGAMQGESISFGLTKREHFAAIAMQGQLGYALSTNPCFQSGRIAEVSRLAVEMADALLRALAAGGEG